MSDADRELRQAIRGDPGTNRRHPTLRKSDEGRWYLADMGRRVPLVATSELARVSRRLYRASGTQSLPHNTATTITYNADAHHEGGELLSHSSGVITIGAGGDGLFMLSAGVALNDAASAAAGFYGLSIVVNTTPVIESKARHNTGTHPRIAVGTTMLLTEGVTVFARLENVQTSGTSAVTAVATGQKTFLAATRIPSIA